jgi:hypothetical protein
MKKFAREKRGKRKDERERRVRAVIPPRVLSTFLF